MSQNSENNFPRHPRQYNPYDSDSTLLVHPNLPGFLASKRRR